VRWWRFLYLWQLLVAQHQYNERLYFEQRKPNRNKITTRLGGYYLAGALGLSALPFGSATLPLKTPTLRRFLHAASSPFYVAQIKNNHPVGWLFVWQGH
jgi:hypothetical protein